VSGAGRQLEEALRHHRAGARDQAERLYREVLARHPDDPRANLLLGTLVAQAGRVAEAVGHFERAARAEPGNADAQASLGMALAQVGRREEAAEALAAAVARNPDHVMARFNLGVLRSESGALDEAAEHFRAVVTRLPDQPDARLNLAEVLRRGHRYEDALEVLDEAVRRHPGLSALRVNRANVLKYLGRIPEAEAAYRDAVAANPDDEVARDNQLLCALYAPDRAPAAIRDLHRAWGERVTARLPAPPKPHANDPDPERPLRVGYVSPDLREHPVAAFVAPILAHHDPGRVAVTAYANVPHPDATTARLKALAPAWRDVAALDDAALAERIRADGIDVLVDLAGHTRGARLGAFARAPAPVQITYLGYPVGTGLPAIGHRLTDPVADPPGTDGLYTEALLRLDAPFCCFAEPERSPDPGPPPARTNGYVTFGSQANPVKVNDKVLALWARVLEAVPDSRLLLGSGEYASRAVRERVLGGLGEGGVGPERVEFSAEAALGKADFLARYTRVDVALDTFPYAGHTTTCEALWMGLPVITLAGEWYIQRVGASLLGVMDLPELVADTPDAYVDAARHLAADTDRLAALRDGLRGRMKASPLMDGAGFTRRLEDAYREAWRRWCTGRGGEGA
jgi:predicted O-linked N-acetylglucosamine transferase (SPINDLY family)